MSAPIQKTAPPRIRKRPSAAPPTISEIIQPSRADSSPRCYRVGDGAGWIAGIVGRVFDLVDHEGEGDGEDVRGDHQQGPCIERGLIVLVQRQIDTEQGQG